ncbi:MAG: DNA polymerase domain-containing protein [Deltaproteobacteria bacterium]|nr:DNA polymerase domain-containing protein [Deltaproteobacteria bacterium]
MAKGESTTLSIDGHDVVVSNPSKVYFPQCGVTKLELAQYYVDVKAAVLVAVRKRPMILKRFIGGIDGQAFFQKRVQKNHPAFIETATFKYKSGGVAEEVVVVDAAGLVWVVNLGCIEMHVHPVRADDLEHPDELRIDLDPGPSFSFKQVVDTAVVVHEVLDDVGLIGWPKTSGSRGVHIWVRIERSAEKRWTYDDVRRAALALAREVERRAPGLATSVWQKTERLGVLVDYNQNAKDRTTASAYSVRPLPDARVSMPLSWADLARCDPAEFTLRTVPAILQKQGDAHAAIDAHAGSLEKLLALADEQEPRKPIPKKAADKGAVVVVAHAKLKAVALEGLERWKAAHVDVVAHLLPDDFIVDAMRGKSSAWYRVRVHLRNVPIELRPAQGTPDPDYDPMKEFH